MEDKIMLFSFIFVWIGTTFYCFRKNMTTITSVGTGFLVSLFGVVVLSALFGQIDYSKGVSENTKSVSQNIDGPHITDKQDNVDRKESFQEDIKPYSYKVMEIRDTSYANHRRVSYNVYLETQQIPDEKRMEATARDVWDKNKRGWDEFIVYMIFGRITDFSAGAYGIANFDRRVLNNFSINNAPLQMLSIGETFSDTVEVKPQQPPWELQDNTNGASIVLTDLIKQRLVSPRTAKFPGMFERRSHVRRIGPGKYSVNSWVDSQNRFGAMVRTNYNAEIHQTGPELHTGDWKIVRFETK